MVNGVAPIIELHYSTNLEDFDQTNLNVSGLDEDVHILNLTGGLRFQLAQQSYLTVAGVAPLRESPDRQFDSEVLAQFMTAF